MEREIVLLTKSKMWGNYCVAGIDINTREWVRLCSNDDSVRNAVPLHDMRYEGGTFAQPFDVVRVSLLGKFPNHFQPENYLYDPQFYWECAGRLTARDVWTLATDILYPDDYLFHDVQWKLRSDVVTKLPAHKRYSLRLVQLCGLRLEVKRWSPQEDVRHTACFYWGGNKYRYMRVTDQDFLAQFPQEGCYDIVDTICVVSLAHEYQGAHYKLLAAIHSYR